ncbi:MAG: Transcriptional regulator, PadR family [Parcubacteria group bacterium GW2011_GWE2_39_37]|uniref:Transcriptional regulator, PadR family n=1 Tax=Candidatus Falkowbacteria bacterium GW2011_GWF2_39_8 TaxID=1618642 RepID=A0A0G0T5L8_9BACT|nr:MAG: Transcriptional regulator, PadR family [Parcubacteria group bacterium GW2011_GWE2_39_37]KKR33107.1 MAG: Transcriptional regulator, PadR family [Candidatus Falkowbacteria bacterium GW2011_GWF2_39_8]
MSKMNEINIENTKAQMRRGILEFCILQVISRDKIYASEILSVLKKANLIVVEGTVYPLLTRLKNSGHLDYDWEESRSGPPRKYYTLTASGKIFLNELKKTWQGLSTSTNSIIKNFK